ncbi:MAG: bifunctional diaminohydroxyphosphoribosylaminopyrimidine deaminase/5-amino-6-(5-phosphoribosylamino)uracil reductase RibD [Armatimonadaceae bacterium]
MPAVNPASFDTKDRRFMRRALHLATRSRTHPNPRVGAVVVRDGEIVGEGWYTGFQNGVSGPHAEAMAFAAAGGKARDATVYVTLEPCTHTTRPDGTPRIPCARRCLDAGIARLVCAMQDPDVRVAGQGFALLREAGVSVEVGLEEDAARELNAAYIRHRETGLPLILHKAAMTLDGKIAAPGGHSRWVTGNAARVAVHKLRNEVDAVLVGIGTLLQDDPQLTTRLPRGNAHNPVRVIMDSKLRFPRQARAAAPGTIVLTGEPVHGEIRQWTEKAAHLQKCGVEVITLPGDPGGRVDVGAAAQFLAERGLLYVLLESGGALAASFWEARLVNRVLFFIAPKVIGGGSAPTPVDGTGLAQTMEGAVQLGKMRVRRYGKDVALEAEVED